MAPILYINPTILVLYSEWLTFCLLRGYLVHVVKGCFKVVYYNVKFQKIECFNIGSVCSTILLYNIVCMALFCNLAI